MGYSSSSAGIWRGWACSCVLCDYFVLSKGCWEHHIPNILASSLFHQLLAVRIAQCQGLSSRSSSTRTSDLEIIFTSRPVWQRSGDQEHSSFEFPVQSISFASRRECLKPFPAVFPEFLNFLERWIHSSHKDWLKPTILFVFILEIKMPWFPSLSLAFFLVFSIIPGVFARVSQQVWAANLKLPSYPMKKLHVDFDLMDQQLLGWTQWICPRVQSIPQEKTLQDTLPRIFPINWEVGHHSVTLLLPCPYFDVFLLLNCPEARLENRNSGNYLYQ